MRKEIVLAGTGGQGIILAGVILAEAATNCGYHVAQSQTYGPEARGGSSACSVVIDHEKGIDFPEAGEPDIILAMSNSAAEHEVPKLKHHGTLIVDSTSVKSLPPTDASTYFVPISAIAREQFGREMVVNIVALGVLTCLTKILPSEAVENAILARVPRGSADTNKRAFAAGISAAEEVLRIRQHA